MGNSGTGKTTGLEALSPLLHYKQLSTYAGATSFTSPAAILRSLSKRNVQLMLVDEIADIIKLMKNPTTPLSAIPALLKEIHYKTATVMQKDYGDDRKNMTVPLPHLSLVGTTTPARFWEAINIQDACDGFLARFLVLAAQHKQKEKAL